MPLTNIELEETEKKYFDAIKLHLKTNLQTILNDLKSRHKIFNDWNTQFISTARPGYNASNLDKGSQRVFHKIFSMLNWETNSTPIGSDLLFETEDAFIHIDVKTAILNNPSDYKGLVNIGRNQTNYPAYKNTDKNFTPNLPNYYNENSQNEKVCLTYAIQIIHENEKENTLAILLISIPNGQLFEVYGNKIVKRGKSAFAKNRSVKDFRFAYHRNPIFNLLQQPAFRIEFIHFDNSLNLEIRKNDITRNVDIP